MKVCNHWLSFAWNGWPTKVLPVCRWNVVEHSSRCGSARLRAFAKSWEEIENIQSRPLETQSPGASTRYSQTKSQMAALHFTVKSCMFYFSNLYSRDNWSIGGKKIHFKRVLITCSPVMLLNETHCCFMNNSLNSLSVNYIRNWE